MVKDSFSGVLRHLISQLEVPQTAAHVFSGAVHWGPPVEAIREAASHATEPSYSAYGPDEGLPELRSALQEKVERDNGLSGVCPAAPCERATTGTSRSYSCAQNPERFCSPPTRVASKANPALISEHPQLSQVFKGYCGT